MILLTVAGRPALRRLFIYRVVGAALVAADECRDLSRDTDRRPADQFPCAGDPDQEANDHQHRDRVHRAGIALLVIGKIAVVEHLKVLALGTIVGGFALFVIGKIDADDVISLELDGIALR